MLTKCEACQHDVSADAKSCPSCGHPMKPTEKKGIGCGTWFLIGVGAVAVLGIIGSANSDRKPAGPVPAAQPAQNAGASDQAPQATWQYSESRDAMHDVPAKYACVTSTNEIEQKWPYHNATADLCLRRRPSGRLESYINLNADGQLICGVEGCRLPFRFDSGGIVSYSASGTTDNDSKVLFIEGAPSLLAHLHKANQTVIEVTLYQNGTQQLIFKTAGLTWK